VTDTGRKVDFFLALAKKVQDDVCYDAHSNGYATTLGSSKLESPGGTVFVREVESWTLPVQVNGRTVDVWLPPGADHLKLAFVRGRNPAGPAKPTICFGDLNRDSTQRKKCVPLSAIRTLAFITRPRGAGSLVVRHLWASCVSVVRGPYLCCLYEPLPHHRCLAACQRSKRVTNCVLLCTTDDLCDRGGGTLCFPYDGAWPTLECKCVKLGGDGTSWQYDLMNNAWDTNVLQEEWVDNRCAPLGLHPGPASYPCCAW
jgi:hypothetical protein